MEAKKLSTIAEKDENKPEGDQAFSDLSDSEEQTDSTDLEVNLYLPSPEDYAYVTRFSQSQQATFFSKFNPLLDFCTIDCPSGYITHSNWPKAREHIVVALRRAGLEQCLVPRSAEAGQSSQAEVDDYVAYLFVKMHITTMVRTFALSLRNSTDPVVLWQATVDYFAPKSSYQTRQALLRLLAFQYNGTDPVPDYRLDFIRHWMALRRTGLGFNEYVLLAVVTASADKVCSTNPYLKSLVVEFLDTYQGSLLKPPSETLGRDPVLVDQYFAFINARFKPHHFCKLCDVNGHRTLDCAKMKIKCDNCKRMGHPTEECTQPPPTPQDHKKKKGKKGKKGKDKRKGKKKKKH